MRATYATSLSVYLIFQRYKFKSKSQPNLNLRAPAAGVFNISKIQIQKQITTGHRSFPQSQWCI